jgi:hypothetical protein
MKRFAIRTFAALAAPAAAGALLLAPPATAAVTTTAAVTRTAAPAATLRCHASMSNSRPKDYTNIYVNVSTIRYAGVTTVAHYKTVNRKHTGQANVHGNASIRYYISGATPGYRVNVNVTVTSGRSRGACSTSFIPHR